MLSGKIFGIKPIQNHVRESLYSSVDVYRMYIEYTEALVQRQRKQFKNV